MLEKLTCQAYYCFLDDYSGNQIDMNLANQEKAASTSPFGVFTYHGMPFRLYNSPSTFQRCMLSIFPNMTESSIEVFMDAFSVFGSDFDKCLPQLNYVLERCTEGITLGHKIS